MHSFVRYKMSNLDRCQICRLTTKNLDEFGKALDGDDTQLFHVDAMLSVPEIVLRPNGTEIYNIVIRSVKDFLER